MQVAKIQLAILAARKFINNAEAVLEQSGSTTNFLLCDGKHAKMLKKLGTRVINAMQDMRRP